MRKNWLDGPDSNFHSRLMAVLHPKLMYNHKLDLFFLKTLENIEKSNSIKFLDENETTQYKQLLIDQTRSLYQR